MSSEISFNSVSFIIVPFSLLLHAEALFNVSFETLKKDHDIHAKITLFVLTSRKG
jgi:hypothetical protein